MVRSLQLIVTYIRLISHDLFSDADDYGDVAAGPVGEIDAPYHAQPARRREAPELSQR